MSNLTIALFFFGALLALIFLRVPVALAMIGCGVFGVRAVTGDWNPVLSSFKSLPFDTFSSYSLSVIPLFLLMGQFAMRGGISEALFRAAAVLFGHRRGGLAISAIGASGGFSAICGSSLATASTMASVVYPEMRRYNYSRSLAAGCLAAGGTLGALIPPSVVLVLYAILAEQNIVKLFAAAIIPGLLAIAGYCLTIAIYVRLKPDAAPPVERLPAGEARKAFVRTLPVVVIFVVMLGGIYAGLFTPTEGAAVGAGLTGLFAAFSGGLKMRGFVESLKGTAITTAMIFLIVLGANIFNTFMAMTQLPQSLSALVGASGLNPWLVLTCMLVMFLVLGCVMDSIAMMMLTVPILLPVVLGLDFGLGREEAAIWFGIIVLVAAEIGVITPPLGMNLFVVQAKATDLTTSEMYRGIFPFICCDLVRLTLIVAVPALSLAILRFL